MSNKPTGAVKRRRGAVLETDILQAVWQELVRVGYHDLTFDSVAEHANTSKTVLYRRWSSKPALVIAAIRHYKPVLTGQIPNTGSLRGDVVALLERMSRNLSVFHRETLVGLLSDSYNNEKIASYLYGQVLASDNEAMAAILKQAAGRGEVNIDNIQQRLLTLPLDLARNELLISGAPMTKKAIAEIVDTIFLPLVCGKLEAGCSLRLQP